MTKLQRRLLAQGAVLIYFEDAGPGDKHYKALQFFALRGFYGSSQWEAQLGEPVPEEVAANWIRWSTLSRPADYVPGKTTRGELLDALYRRVLRLPPEKIGAIRAGG